MSEHHQDKQQEHAATTSNARNISMRVIAAALSLVLFSTATSTAHAQTRTDAQTMRISRRAERPSQPGSSEYFTGQVRVTPLFDTTSTSRAAGASVTFEPGARSAWHTHPLGQRLIVTAGTGRIQQWGGPVEVIQVGDVVWTPPGVKHWHGAGTTTSMSHMAIQEVVDGRNVDWMEKVTNAQYQSPSARSTSTMADTTTTAGPYADIAPALDDFTRNVLYGQVWEGAGLSKRDRSLITVATLVAQYRTNELPFHLKLAMQNGVTREELSELITHLAFYAGWPTANTAVEIARKVFAETPK